MPSREFTRALRGRGLKSLLQPPARAVAASIEAHPAICKQEPCARAHLSNHPNDNLLQRSPPRHPPGRVAAVRQIDEVLLSVARAAPRVGSRLPCDRDAL